MNKKRKNAVKKHHKKVAKIKAKVKFRRTQANKAKAAAQ
jgi:hypothetical protein